MNNEINGKQLFDWISENDLTLRFDSVEQAEFVVKYFEQSGYQLQIDNTGLKRTVIDQEGMRVESIIIDDVIDMAVETFYEEHMEDILILKKELSQLDRSSNENRQLYAKKMLELTKKDYVYGVLCKAFDKTVYGKKLYQNMLNQNRPPEMNRNKVR